jgi:hypothetical protein
MARRTHTYAIRLAVEGGGQLKAELVSVGQSGEQSLKRIESAGERASGRLKGLGRQAELLRTGIRALGGTLIGVTTVGGLAALVDRSISAANAIGKTADTIGVGVEALQELRFAAKASGGEQQTLDMALQRFVRRVAEAANGTYGHRAARPETIGPEAVRSGVGHTPHKRWLDQPAALGSGAGTRSRPWRFPRHGLTGARARSSGPHFGEHPRLDRCSADFDYQEYGFGLMTEACTISSGGG